MTSLQIYSLAIGANLTFSTAGLIFSFYARRFSPMWMNQVKVLVASIAFVMAMLLSGQYASLSGEAFLLLFFSGFAGLCVGDIFLFRAFATLGAGRSLVLFSFQPLLLGLYGYFFLGQLFSTGQTFAVLCMITCVFVFMLESNQLTGSWGLKNFLWAFSGIFLDALGVMLTRSAYELTPDLGTWQVNVVRCAGALFGFLILRPRSYLDVYQGLKSLNLKENIVVIGASVGGCFLALALYLTALKHAHVGTLTAISITGPVWVSLLECLYHRRWPNRYLSVAFMFFVIGFALMLKA